MTADADLRDRTSQRAFELSQVAKEIAEGTNYEHFEMLYYDFDIEGEFYKNCIQCIQYTPYILNVKWPVQYAKSNQV